MSAEDYVFGCEYADDFVIRCEYRPYGRTRGREEVHR
jgi:hypothetical protein